MMCDERLTSGRTVRQVREFVHCRIDQIPESVMLDWHRLLRDRIDEQIRRTRNDHRGGSHAA